MENTCELLLCPKCSSEKITFDEVCICGGVRFFIRFFEDPFTLIIPNLVDKRE